MFSHFHLSYTFFFFARTPQKWCPALSVSRLLRCICLGAADGHLAHGAQGPGDVCRVSPLRSYYCLLYNQSGSYGISFRNCINTLFLIVFSPTNFSSHRGFLTQTIFTVVFAERWFKFFFALFFFYTFPSRYSHKEELSLLLRLFIYSTKFITMDAWILILSCA